MKKGSRKAPSVDHLKLPALAEAATRIAAEAGVTNMVAVPEKRTIQWRVKFNSDVRKANAGKRKYQDHFDTFGVSKYNAVARMAKQGVAYDDIIVKAYAAIGVDYNEALAATVKPAKVAKAKPVEGDVTKTETASPQSVDKQVDALLNA